MLIYLWKELGGDNVGYGLLMTQFGALQLLGNLLSGAQADLSTLIPIRMPCRWLSLLQLSVEECRAIY